jgi:hypothetical protein
MEVSWKVYVQKQADYGGDSSDMAKDWEHEKFDKKLTVALYDTLPSACAWSCKPTSTVSYAS